jgi:hypothetical protein
MATHLDCTSDHARSSSELDRLLKVFSELDDASIELESEEAALDKESAEARRRRPASRLTEPVLQGADYRVLLDGARQGRAFANRVSGAPN